MDFDSLDEFESVPLPHQLPKAGASEPIGAPAPFEGSAKSRTIQTLLNQNQDLMARLTVSLKRNIEIEQKIEHQEDLYQKLLNHFETLKDQADIHQEKNRRMEFESQKIIDENASYEKRFGELYSAYQDKIGYIQKLSYRLHRYLQYRKRIKGYIRPFISNLKNTATSLKTQILELNEKTLKQNELILDLKEKLTQAVDHIQSITKQNEKDQTELVDYHEERYQKIYDQLQKALDEKEAVEAIAAEQKIQIHTLTENEVNVTNKSIFFERKYTDLKTEFEKISQDFLNQRSVDVNKITTLELQLRDLLDQHTQTVLEKNQLLTENQSLNDQYQSMQILYQDSILKMEDFKKKQNAQDQINKELSQALLETRKKSETLEEKLIASDEDFKRKLQSFQVRFNRPTITENPTVQSVQPAQQPQGQKDLLNKIQNLLSEIQTGHTHGQVDFKEDLPVGTDQLVSEFGDIEKN